MLAGGVKRGVPETDHALDMLVLRCWDITGQFEYLPTGVPTGVGTTAGVEIAAGVETTAAAATVVGVLAAGVLATGAAALEFDDPEDEPEPSGQTEGPGIV